MPGPIKISVVIITYNEEKNIGRCLESVRELADEIVVVDSFSKDKTKEIALHYGAKWIENKFEGHVEQKNFALDQAKYSHVLSLDADEALSEELKTSIQEIKENCDSESYSMNRLSSYCGQWIRYCGWYPDKKVRFVNRHKARWGGDNPHDKLIPKEQGTIHLKGDILHYTYYTISEHIRQVDYFTDIAAMASYRKGKKSNLFLILTSPVFRFFKSYFIKRGFLDGYYGFVVCSIQAFSNFSKYVKLLELNKKFKV